MPDFAFARGVCWLLSENLGSRIILFLCLLLLYPWSCRLLLLHLWYHSYSQILPDSLAEARCVQSLLFQSGGLLCSSHECGAAQLPDRYFAGRPVESDRECRKRDRPKYRNHRFPDLYQFPLWFRPEEYCRWFPMRNQSAVQFVDRNFRSRGYLRWARRQALR